MAGSDTHAGRPEARTAVFATKLTRDAIFDALKARRCYAVTGARIRLDFRINGHGMGAEVAVAGRPRLEVAVEGTAPIAGVVIVRDGAEIQTFHPNRPAVRISLNDESFPGSSWYYVRVTQADCDAHGNPSRAWSSPIWVHRRL